MPLNRRNFIAGIGIVAGMGLASPYMSGAVAADTAPATASTGGQVPGVYRTKVGQIKVTSIFDGGMQMGSGILIHPDEPEVNRLKQKAFITGDGVPGYLNTFLVDTGKKVILVDTGYGAGSTEGTGRMPDNLKAAGYDLSQIDEVLLTHAHPDHVGGLLSADGARVFPKAKIRISEEDLSFWFSNEKMVQMKGKESAFEAARKKLGPYKDSGQIETFKLGQDLGGGFTSVDLRGHTPGHSGIRISDGKDQLLIWGDIVHMQALQFTHPEWSLVFDIDPAQAIKTRQKILEEVTADRIRIGGMHLCFPGIGHIEKSASGYALVPQMWESELQTSAVPSGSKEE